MKFNDDITQSIASTVKDVLEGKAIKKEEVKYPHDMYHPKTGEKEVAKNEADHKALTAKGYTHEKPKLDEVEEPRPEGEKNFKKMHKIKKSGEDIDGSVVKEHTISISESTIDVDYIGDKDLSKKLEKKFKIKIKATGRTTADVSGNKANIIKFLKSDAYLMDEDEIEDTFPELMEARTEESDKQAKYKKVFNAALKKFGVNSPAELEGDKKKEFFDYVDSNYDAGDNESDVDEAKDEEKDIEENVFKLKNYKDRDRKGHEAYMNLEIVKGNTGNKYDDDFGFNKAELDAMDKLISKIKNMHISSFDGGNTAPASLEFYGDEASLKKFVADKNVQKIVKKYKGKINGPRKA